MVGNLNWLSYIVLRVQNSLKVFSWCICAIRTALQHFFFFFIYVFQSSSHIALFGHKTTVPLVALVHRCSDSTIELKRHDHRASTIKLKSHGRSSVGADDSCYLCLALSAGIWRFLSISVCFGISATIPVGRETQCLLYAAFFYCKLFMQTASWSLSVLLFQKLHVTDKLQLPVKCQALPCS